MEKDTRYNKRKQGGYGKRNQKNGKQYHHQNNDNPLVAEYQDTLEYFRQNPIPTPASILIKIDRAGDLSTDPITSDVEICNADSFEMAVKYVAEGYKPLVLNMASDFKAGGGVAKGSKAQEEDLFRRSSYRCVMDDSMYPLAPDEIIYSPKVYICKDSSYKYLKEPVCVACIAVPGVRHPSVIVHHGEEEYMNQEDKDRMIDKIAAIFQVAIENGHDALVLGALGCGVFANPVHAVAKIFRDCIATYDGKFKRIGFAILANNNRGVNNLVTFRTILTKEDD